MNNKKKQWEVWIKDMKSKGYSKKDMRKNLKEKGYSDKVINKAFKLGNTGQNKTIYLIAFVCVIVIGVLLLVNYLPSQKTTPTTPSIFTQVMLSADFSEEQEDIMLEKLENSFNQQCGDIESVPSNICYPYVIYTFVEARKKLGIPEEQVHTTISINALNLWRDYYVNAEFNNEGLIIGEESVLLSSISQFYYFMKLAPEPEKEFWFEKVAIVSPSSINMRYFLLKIYWNYFGVSRVSFVPEDMISQKDINNLCTDIPIIREDWNDCEVLYYFKIKDFCELEIEDQETEFAEQVIGINTDQEHLLVCKNLLEERILG